MAGNQDLEKRLKSAISSADAIGKWTKQALTALSARSAKLEAAIKAGNATMMELLTEEIETSLKKADQEIANVDYVLKEDVGPCRKQEYFAEQHSKQIESVVERLSGYKMEARRAFDQAEKLLGRAAEAMKKAATGKEAALDGLAALDLRVKRRCDEMQAAVDMTTSAQQAAVEALAKRDAAALRNAQGELQAANPESEQKGVDELVGEIEAFRKRWKSASLGDELDKQIATVCDKLKKKAESLRAPLLTSLATAKVVRAYSLPKPDARKAIKALGLPDGQEARVTKALALGSKAMEASFDALAKELRLKSNGKQMVSTLAKAGVI